MSVIKLKKDKETTKGGLLVENPVYKPFRYPWCYDAWLTQQRIHWLPVYQGHVRDWQKNLSQQKNLLTQIFRFFSSDVEVNNCYQDTTQLFLSHRSFNDDDAFCRHGDSSYCSILSPV